jgi:hypothetical protein
LVGYGFGFVCDFGDNGNGVAPEKADSRTCIFQVFIQRLLSRQSLLINVVVARWASAQYCVGGLVDEGICDSRCVRRLQSASSVPLCNTG